MSNHMHLECWSHEPHIVDDSWVGSNDSELPAIRLALSDRIVSGPASCAPGAVDRARNLAAFIRQHLTCDIRVVDEAGNDRTADDEPPVFPMVLMRPDGTASTSIPPASIRSAFAQVEGRIRSVIVITEEADA